MDTNAYTRSFDVLLSDFERLTEFVEPNASNSDTYSFRIYELILRACTEFESICKELLVEGSYDKLPKHMDINDYKTLESSLFLESIKVSLVVWSPENDFIQPFDGWSTNKPPLDWYEQYNVIKHNRNREFARANLGNLRYSICGLFCCLVKAGVTFHGGEDSHWVGNDTVETQYKAVPFTIRRTDSEALSSLERGQGRLTLG